MLIMRVTPQNNFLIRGGGGGCNNLRIEGNNANKKRVRKKNGKGHEELYLRVSNY